MEIVCVISLIVSFVRLDYSSLVLDVVFFFLDILDIHLFLRSPMRFGSAQLEMLRIFWNISHFWNWNFVMRRPEVRDQQEVQSQCRHNCLVLEL